MCDKELLLGYLYDDLSAADRQAFDRHLGTCVECRDEVAGLRGTRAQLTAWTPPVPDLGFQVVRGAAPAVIVAPIRWWQSVPAWGLAAAAMLTIAVSAAIAHVEVRFAPDGVVVRTGWQRADENRGDVVTAANTPTSPAATAATSSEDARKIEARLAALEGQLAGRQPAALATASVNRMSDAELLRLVRQQIGDSEQRQKGLLAAQILQVSRDTENARRTDIDRLLTAYRELQGTSLQTFQRQKALEDHVMRVGLQR